MSNLNTNYLSELEACWEEYNKALSDCSKQLRIAQVHSQIARDKAVETEYWLAECNMELNKAGVNLEGVCIPPSDDYA